MHLQEGNAAKTPPSNLSISQDNQAVFLLDGDCLIQDLNSPACQKLNVTHPAEVKNNPISEHISISAQSVKNLCRDLINGVFSSTSDTIIPSVNAPYAYNFSLDYDTGLVKLTLKNNPFV